MKILLLGDLHLRYRGPSSRTDDFFLTQMRKFNRCLEIFNSEGCEFLLQAGDFFDSPRPPNFLMARYIDVLKRAGVVVNSVLGQHDVAMHNLQSVERSAVEVFKSAEVMRTLGSTPAKVGDILVYGASWGEPAPTPERNTRAILVIHAMIGDNPLYPGHDPVRPRSFLHTHSGYELVLCGDYHYRFMQEEQGRKIVNCGALVRLNTSTYDQELHPAVAVYDTVSQDLKFIEIEHESVENVFRLTKEGKPDKGCVLEFVERMRGQMGITVSFRDNLVRYLNENPVGQDIKDEILDVLGAIQ